MTAGASGLLFIDASHKISYPIRAAAAVVAILSSYLYIRAWHEAHANSVKDGMLVGEEEFPELAQYSSDQLLRALMPEIERFDNLTNDGAQALARDLLHPSAQRRKVVERIELRIQQSIHQVDIAWAPDSTVRVASGVVLPILRRYKSETPREVEVEGGRQLGAFETIGLLVVVCSRLAGLPAATASPDLALFQRRLIAAITDHPDQPGQPTSTASVIAAIDETSDRQRTRRNRRHRSVDANLRPVLNLLRVRRPHFAYYELPRSSKPVIHTRFSYRDQLHVAPYAPDYDRWRRRKDNLRKAWGFPPRLVYLTLERARSAHSYELYVSCEDHLYVDEANVVAAGRFIRPLPRWRNSPTYIGWDEPRGKAFTSLGAVNVGRSMLTCPEFVLRLTEKPPGTLAAAASTGFATAIAIWLVGIVGQSDGTDLVAFILALPAVGSTALGLLSTGVNHGLRSLTAILSLAASLALSIVGIVVYLQQQGTGLNRLNLSSGQRLYLESNTVWLTLFLLAVVNTVVAAATLFSRLGRYRSQIRRRETQRHEARSTDSSVGRT